MNPKRTLSSLAAALTILPAASYAAVNFEKEILPVFKERCLDCHQAPREENGKVKKPKADLRLDAAWAILKGGEDGKILTPKASDKSDLYECLTLPSDDDKHMPPKGDPLTAEQIKLVKTWIDEGADFGGWEGNLEGRPAELGGSPAVAKKRDHEEFYKKLEQGAKAAPDAVQKKLKDAGVQLAPISVTSVLLRADFLTGVSKCTDDSVKVLTDISDNVAHLDLGRCAITDGALATVAKLPRLAKLDLRQTKVGDKGVESLTALKNLRYLNLYGTEVTDAGVAQLAKIKSLKEVFLAGTKATEAGAKKLQAAIPGVEVVLK